MSLTESHDIISTGKGKERKYVLLHFTAHMGNTSIVDTLDLNGGKVKHQKSST